MERMPSPSAVLLPSRDTSPAWVAFLAVASLLCGLPGGRSAAFAQHAVAPTSEVAAEDFFEVVDVSIANIDVWVTDKKGNPIDGLGKDDFTVYQDGRPTEVVNFYAVSRGRPASSNALGEAATVRVPDSGGGSIDRDAGPPSNELVIAPEHQLWLIVYIDNYNIDPLERNRVFPALRSFLRSTVRAGDQAMLVTYNRTLKVQQPFTNDIDLLEAALAGLADDSGHAVVRKRAQISTLQRIDKARSAGRALLYARQYAEEQMSGVQYTTDALERLIESLGGLPGRKALVHVSSGIPMTAGEEMFHAVAEKFGGGEAYNEIPRHDTSRRFERVDRLANAHRVVFHTVDAGGLRGMEFGNAEYGGFVDGRLRSILDSVVPENLQAPLRLMALETGGQVIVNQNEILPALRKVALGFRSFYSLGISSSGGAPGGYHKVEVKLRDRRRDLRLRHRAGYRSKTRDTRVRESLRSALLYAQEANPGNVEVTWGLPVRSGEDGNYLLPIQLDIPLDGVVLLPTMTGRHEARLRLFVAAVGADGEASEVDTAPLGIRLADEHVEAAKRESLVHTHRLLLSPGPKRVGVAILDLFGGESSVVTRSVQVGPVEEGG